MTDPTRYEEYAALLKALSHPVRLCIVKGLADASCNVTHMQECLNVPQSVVSQHLARLKAAGLIRGVRCGNEICYELSDERVIKILQSLF